MSGPAARGGTSSPHDQDDPAAALLEEAARRAAVGDRVGAASSALQAADLLPVGDQDRHDALALGAQLLMHSDRFLDAADAWAAAASEAPDDASRASDRNGEGEAARRGGAWPRAVAAHEQALALAEAALGETVEAAVAAQSLAMTYKYTGRFDDAEALYRRALRIAESVGDQRLVAVVCHNLGGLAHARGDHRVGVPWARRSVEVRQAVGDPLGVASDRGALAGLLVETGDLDGAEALLRSARRTFVDVLGPADHEVGVVEHNLAAIALRRGRLALAERHARAALTIKEHALGSASPELAPTLTMLGTIRSLQGSRRDAGALHRRALTVLRPVVEPDHPLLHTIEANLHAVGAEPPTLTAFPGWRSTARNAGLWGRGAAGRVAIRWPLAGRRSLMSGVTSTYRTTTQEGEQRDESTR